MRLNKLSVNVTSTLSLTWRLSLTLGLILMSWLMFHQEPGLFGISSVQANPGVDIASEVGLNDFRLSDMGPDRDTRFGPNWPAVAYNSQNNEFLAVWHSNDNSGALVNNEFEIFGQRIDAITGAEVGANDFRVSQMGPDGDTNFMAALPEVAYNSQNNEYLVVWYGVQTPGIFGEHEFEIFGQRLDAATGAEVGPNDFRISDMGPDGDVNFDGMLPAVTYNRVDNEYLVVWQGDDNIGSLVVDEHEIFGQRLDAATGAEVGPNDFRISDIGPDGDINFGSNWPTVTYNATNNEYLVLWEGDDNSGSLVDNEFEIFGQRLDAGTGIEVGPNDFRLSDMGSDGDVNFAGFVPAAAYNKTNNEYLVVWYGKDVPLAANDTEIFGQRLNAATGAEIGANDFRISDMGPPGASNIDGNAFLPDVAYNRAGNEYFVVWYGDDITGFLVDSELEIHGQRLDGTNGAENRPK